MSEEAKISSLEEAVPYVAKKINKRLQADTISKVYSINQGLHKILRTHKDQAYHLIYKRKPFMSFGKIFDNFKGVGESVNKEVVKEAVKKDVDNFVFCYGSGKVYVCNPVEFKNFAEKNDTIRETSSGETTYSVPIRLLRRWK